MRLLFFCHLDEENQIDTSQSPSENSTTDEPSAKKAKVEFPLAQTFEISEAFRSGKDAFF